MGERYEYGDSDRKQDRLYQHGVYRDGDKDRARLIDNRLRAGSDLCPDLRVSPRQAAMLAWIFAEERVIEQGTCEIMNGGLRAWL